MVMEAFRRAVASGFAFSGLKDAIESFHEGVGEAPFPMGQNSFEMVLEHLGNLKHGSEHNEGCCEATSLTHSHQG
jgi:hypothetical protein